jgi:hypothetical protein
VRHYTVMMKTLLIAVLLALQTTAPIFRFETDGFWLNLHHFLYVLGRVDAKMPDITREAVAGAAADAAAPFAALSPAEREAWREAVTVYANGMSRLDTVRDRKLFDLTNAVRRLPADRAAKTLTIDADVAAALDRAAPVYRKAWWPQHRESNRKWLASMQSPLKQYGPAVLAYISRAYQEPWMTGGYPVNVSAWSNWAGAYSTNDSLLVVSTLNQGNQGLHGFEITFHEAMHQWDDQIHARLMKVAAANNIQKFDRLLTHAMIFYTTGEAMRSVVPTHVPYSDIAGIWKGRMGSFKSALDTHWKPYLDGKSTLDAALLGLLR